MADQNPAPAQANPAPVAVPAPAEPQVTPPAKEGDGAAAAAPAPAPVDGTNPPAPAAPAKPAEPAAAAPPKPDDKSGDTIDLKLPEGSKLQAADLEQIKSFAKEHGLSKESAQALLDRESAAVIQREQFVMDQMAVQSDAWKQELIGDKDFGGEKANETAQLAHTVAKSFGDQGFVDELDRTGMGNHPGLVKMLARIGRAMEPGKMVNISGPAAAPKKSLEQKFYGDSTPQT